MTNANNSTEKDGAIFFEGNYVPSPKLIGDEKELMTIKAGLMEIGPVGFILRQKERLVLTNERIFQFSSRLGTAYLRTMYLKQVESVTIGGQINSIILVIIVALLSVILLGDIHFAVKVLLLFVAIILVLLSRRKVISVSSGDRKNSIVLPLKRMRPKETQEFIDKISKEILKK